MACSISSLARRQASNLLAGPSAFAAISAVSSHPGCCFLSLSTVPPSQFRPLEAGRDASASSQRSSLDTSSRSALDWKLLSGCSRMSPATSSIFSVPSSFAFTPSSPSSWSQRLQHSAATRNASTLVVAEQANGKVAPATLSTIAAATAIGGPLTVLVAGAPGDASKAASSLASDGRVSKIFLAESPRFAHAIAESIASLTLALQGRNNFSHILAPSSTFGRNFLPRVAALLDAAQVSDIIEVVDEDTFVRPIYAGNALNTVRYLGEGPRVLTVRTTAFPSDPVAGTAAAPIEDALAAVPSAAEAGDKDAEWLSAELRIAGERPELGAAKAVVSGGRALKSAENFKMLDELADLLGGAVGASRAAVDAGMCPNDLQVGQTGKVVAPQLYVAIGISGAIQHLAGMKDSRVIVAINNDADAPIFKAADYGLVGDLFQIVPELTTKLRAALKK